MTNLVEDVARAIETALFAAHHEEDGFSICEDQARAAISVIASRLGEPSDELVELFVEYRDEGFGWKPFYRALADHLEGK